MDLKEIWYGLESYISGQGQWLADFCEHGYFLRVPQAENFLVS
jgi:hypothetical protein